ncbi:MFS transporter [Flavobacterium capsici]|uniref:MFS transporter n=1 Tax=Flavobacterium capsici TaxID=3075618 RepID=A0AA96J249_9FLAO|nr:MULTISPECIES: MFS transporter [unclassified Flavobacterium]WNM18690.1 MFS transporter [Flavobacterium sp. PMR2A8]WNM22741.1 MFS transporter [Flavobacterium sp. PMTSA4]
MGFCFATWASRIPDIKSMLLLSEAGLGTLLFALPAGQLSAMPFSGRTVTKYGSRKVLLIAILLYSFCLTLLGLAGAQWQLAIGLYIFGVCGNFCNIAVNTQGVHTQQLFDKPIMGSFHGSWSLAGFCGALVSLIVMSFGLTPYQHFLVAFGIVALIVLTNYKFIVATKVKKQENKESYSFRKNPDTTLIWLGAIAFCCMASEGIMFDWSGVYFREIVKVPGALVVLGYTSFMISMASGRFLSDILVRKYGVKRVLITSGIVISTGLYMAVLFPYIVPCTVAFMLVGFGVSNVIPTVISIAGNNANVPTGIALTIVSSISFLGFLIGPPLIGFIAELTSLKYSFAIIGVFGVFISVLVSRLKIFK